MFIQPQPVDGEDQPSPKLRLHRSRNMSALGGRRSKPSHGDAHRQHLPHRKETGREQPEEKKLDRKGKAKGRRWDQPKPRDLHLPLPNTRVPRDTRLGTLWPMGERRVLNQLLPPAATACWDAHRGWFFPESQSILLDVKESHQAPSPRPPTTDLWENDHWQLKKKEKRSTCKVPAVISWVFLRKSQQGTRNTLFCGSTVNKTNAPSN